MALRDGSALISTLEVRDRPLVTYRWRIACQQLRFERLLASPPLDRTDHLLRVESPARAGAAVGQTDATPLPARTRGGRRGGAANEPGRAGDARGARGPLGDGPARSAIGSS